MDRRATFGAATPIVGMVHLPPLPGSPAYEGSREDIRARALADATALADGGVDALLLENYGDAPYHPDAVPAHTVAEMSAVARDLARAVDIPIGVNVLRNDPSAAIAIAAAAGGTFVRSNVYVGARVTDQGVLESQAHEAARRRDRVDADVAILADVGVKHSGPIADRPVEAVVAEAVDRGRADGLVVSGPETGTPADADRLKAVCAARDERELDVPVFVGSGVTEGTVADHLERADGVIVGTGLKRDGETANPVDPDRVASLVVAARGA